MSSTTTAFKLTVGLEIHAELDTNSKMFCDSPNHPAGDAPNQFVCPVCMAHPGTLPVINMAAVEHVVRVGLALGGTINDYTQFDRKNYFYPDLPKGYQISQYKHPIVSGGSITLKSGKVIRITRVHLEEDTGRLSHAEAGTSLVDFNRAGVPLMELVTEPDIASAAEAREFAEELQLILRYVGASHARMEMGEMRVEANISVAPEGAPLGTKVEVKNINSFRSVEGAIAYEYDRHVAAIEAGEKIVQETRGWDEVKNATFSQRIKEDAHDYRYFPEPDLPPLRMNVPGGIQVSDVEKQLPELPGAKRARLVKEYGFDLAGADALVRDRALANFFEQADSELQAWLKAEGLDAAATERGKKLLKNYLLSDVVGLMTAQGKEWEQIPMTPENYAELIAMLVADKISSRGAKDLLTELMTNGGDPSQIVSEKGLLQVSDDSALLSAIGEVKVAHEKAFNEFVRGSDNTLQYLVGMTMKAVKAKGQSANPQKLQELWKKERGN